MRKRNLRNLRNNERGIALLIVLMALFLIAAIGMGMICMSNTETAVNQNYRDTQLAFFAMRGGLEEMRDRMRTNAPSPITVPTVMPGTTAGSVIYITNPAASETVDPKTYSTTNKYFDDEFCHESFVGSGVTYRTPGTVCGSSDVPPSGATTTASVMPYTGTSSSLKYKWVRITLKQNNTFPTAPVAPIDSTHLAASQVCWDSVNNKEVVLSSLGSTYADCAAARANGLMVEPVYVVTSLAITPQGSRRIGQYETAATSITPPDSGLSLDGPGSGANFNPASSANGTIDGRDGFGSPPALPNCNPVAGATVPAIGASDMTDRNTLAGAIPNNRTSNYPGTAPLFPTGVTAIPSVVDMGSDAGGTNQLSSWSTPAQLNAMVSQIANAADQTVTGCGMAGTGTPCSGTYGTVAHPQITYVNGDVNLNGGAGVLVVTGNLTYNGSLQFNGLILVIGQGQMVVHGGANTAIYGAVFVATTNSSTSPYAPLASLAAPSFLWSGGGNAGVYYNSCWANIGNKLHYMVVASREEMY